MSELGPANGITRTLCESESSFSDGFHKFREKLNDVQGATRKKAGEIAKTTSGAIHHHPYSALGFAVAAGLVMGFLATKRVDALSAH